ncbi:hypothetical protein AOQ84DRAFT_404263 [Glonium stellatum]|uniref:Uncharacterized protein n=1 Tax=Glonium stellatum TaxID=574774 RepID=A0A8E2FE99_9PEZI|nr:hypothetical protein AOQ84DRAFT_404263 [Glonium stellatum]
MIPGYSKILVNDIFLSEKTYPMQSAGPDWLMMITFSGIKRTEAQWQKLLDEAGLGATEVWYPPK